ncbi:MAG: GPP34 family phosphoprotein [Acidimicrobiales bacterium]
MNLAEQLALVVIDPDSGRPEVPTKDGLLRGLIELLLGQLVLDGHLEVAGEELVVSKHTRPDTTLLVSVIEVVQEHGPGAKPVIVRLYRGIGQHRSHGTWDAVVERLVANQEIEPGKGFLHEHHLVDDLEGRSQVVDRLRTALTGDGVLDPETALLAHAAGWAGLVKHLVDDDERSAAEQRAEHALEGSPVEALSHLVRRYGEDAIIA